MKSSIVFLFLLMLVTVTKLNGQNIQASANDVCPGDPIVYSITPPTGCVVVWDIPLIVQVVAVAIRLLLFGIIPQQLELSKYFIMAQDASDHLM